jgi:hypothetical protein
MFEETNPNNNVDGNAEETRRKLLDMMQKEEQLSQNKDNQLDELDKQEMEILAELNADIAGVEGKVSETPSGTVVHISRDSYIENKERLKEQEGRVLYDKGTPHPVHSDEVRPSSQAISGPPEEGEWTMIPASKLPSAIFYPSDLEVYVRRATVRDIQQWSNMNEENGYSFITEVNRLITSCCRLKRRSSGVYLSPDLIRITDKLFLVLFIREWSYGKDTSLPVEYVHDIDSCNHTGEVSMDTSKFEMFNPLDIEIKISGEDKIKLGDFYNDDTEVLAFEFTSEYSDKPHRLAPPTIGLENSFYEWAKKKLEKNKKYKFDESFLIIAPMLKYNMSKASFEGIDKWYNDYRAMNRDEFTLIEVISKEIRIGIKHMVHKCHACGSEVHTELNFPDGVKSILLDKRGVLSKLKRPIRKN